MKKIYEQGFTLIEVMITVVIIGILASIAYPSYIDYVVKSGRSEGVAAVMKVANLQEQYYLDNRSYALDMKSLGLDNDPFETEHGYYTVDFLSDDAKNVAEPDDPPRYIEFIITATVNPDSRQVKDTTCATITMTSAGVKGPSAECWK